MAWVGIMTYKKRAKDGWNCGKYCKKQSNQDERQYEKKEIRNEIAEHEQGDDFRYKHLNKTNKNEKARMESKIARYTRWIGERCGIYNDWWISHIRDSLEKAKKKYKDKYDK